MRLRHVISARFTRAVRSFGVHVPGLRMYNDDIQIRYLSTQGHAKKVCSMSDDELGTMWRIVPFGAQQWTKTERCTSTGRCSRTSFVDCTLPVP